ncbi:MAG: hypothetical protein EBZ50_03130 [Alphaproteobacteria bacterium]|nr:hypothetical protein [Alphaproteobacteria bacterium]
MSGRVVSVPAEVRIVAVPAETFDPIQARRYRMRGAIALSIGATGRARVNRAARGRVAIAITASAKPMPIARVRGRPLITVSAAAYARIARAVRGAAGISITASGQPEIDSSHLLSFGEVEYFRWNDVEYASPLNIPGAVFTSLDPITDIVGGRLVTFAAGTLPASVNGLLMWPEDRISLSPWPLTTRAGDNPAAGVTRTNPAISAPDETLSVVKVIEGTANQVHNFAPGLSTSITSGGFASAQIMAKAAERQGVSFGLNGPATRGVVHVNLLTGAILGEGFMSTTKLAADVLPLVDGWWLIRLSVSVQGTVASWRVSPMQTLVDPASASGQTYTGDGVSGVLVAYPCVEASAQPGPVIPNTTVSAITRRANRLVLPFVPPSEGIFVAEMTPRLINPNGGRILGLTFPKSPLQITSATQLQSWDGSAGLAHNAASTVLNRRFRAALSYSGAGSALGADGQTPNTGSAVADTGTPSTSIAIGSGPASNPIGQPGHYHRITFLRRRDDARLPSLTSTPVVGPTHWLRFDPASALYRWGGKTYSSLLSIPGVAFTQLDPITDVVNGQLVTFAAGVPAISANGLLLWPEDRSNLALRSEAFDNAAWVKTNATITTGIADPRGGTAAQTLTATGANGEALQAVGGSLGTGTTYAGSIFVRRRTGSGTVWLFNPNGAGVTAIVPTSSWQRFSVSGPGVASGNNYVGIRLATSGDEVDVFGGQFEVGAVASPYMATTTATVTRRANRLVLPWQITPAGMMVAEVTARQNNPATSGRIVGLAGSHAALYLDQVNAARAGTFNEASAFGGSATATGSFIGRRAKIGVGWSQSGRIMAYDGATRGGDANSFAGASGWGYTQLALASQTTGTAATPGHYHALSIFGFRDDSRLPSLTT